MEFKVIELRRIILRLVISWLYGSLQEALLLLAFVVNELPLWVDLRLTTLQCLYWSLLFRQKLWLKVGLHSFEVEEMLIFRQICKISPTAWACPFFCLCVCVTIVHTDQTLAKIKNVKNDVCRISHLPSNGIIAKIVLCDHDLLFESQRLESRPLQWRMPIQIWWVWVLLHFLVANAHSRVTSVSTAVLRIAS